MWLKEWLIKNLKNFFFTGVVLLCLAFVEKRQKERKCTHIKVEIFNDVDNYFLREKEVLELSEGRGKEHLVGGKLIHIPLKTIENRIEKSKFVKRAEVHKDHQGKLNIEVYQNRPIARFFYKDTSFYLSEEGGFMPLSNRYTSRVTIVRGAGLTSYVDFRNKTNWKVDSSFYGLLNHVNTSKFYKAQIQSIEVLKNGEIVFYPQVTKQKVFFGKPENIEEKFKKLDVFYKKILPATEWNLYESVNVKFKDQVICE